MFGLSLYFFSSLIAPLFLSLFVVCLTSFIYIYMHLYVCVYIYIYTFIHEINAV